MSKLVPAILLGCALLASPARTATRSFDHEMTRFTVTHGNGSVHQRTEVRVFDAKSKKTIWFRRYDGWTSVGWSDDRLAIAIAEPLAVTVWRFGSKVRKFRLPALNGTPGLGAYIGGVVWSPDKNHLLLRIPASDQETARNTGRLVCFDARSGRSQTVGSDIFSAEWRDPRSVIIRQVDPRVVGDSRAFEPHLSEPRIWTVPPRGIGR